MIAGTSAATQLPQVSGGETEVDVGVVPIVDDSGAGRARIAGIYVSALLLLQGLRRLAMKPCS